MSTPEAIARQKIDALLEEAGWCVQDDKALILMAGPGVDVREPGHGPCDYRLIDNTRPVWVIEATTKGTYSAKVMSKPEQIQQHHQLKLHGFDNFDAGN